MRYALWFVAPLIFASVFVVLGGTAGTTFLVPTLGMIAFVLTKKLCLRK